MRFIKYIIATHGEMASGVYNTVKMISGENKNVTIINAYKDGRDFEEEYYECIKKIENEDIIVFTDIAGGSVNQIASRSIVNNQRIHVITGINLALILDIIMINRDTFSKDDIENSIKIAKEQIIYMNEILQENEGDDSND